MAPAVCAIGVALLLWGAVLLFPVYVSKEGLRSYTLWGDYRTIPWDRIDTIRPINFLGLRYLRAGTHGAGAPVWVPLWLSDKRGFGEEITRLAGPEHPLVKAWKGKFLFCPIDA